MPVAYRSGNTVTNGTAGTSVTVSKPAGMTETGVAGADVMVAYIAATGAPTFTAPAGWTLIATIASGSNVTLKAYWKLASTEGATFTWTLGTSQRNFGWVSAYTGVHPTAPIHATGTDDTLDTSTILAPTATEVSLYGLAVTATAAVRVASGAATTWTEFAILTTTERVDLSTNAGAGTDISGVGTTTPYPALDAFSFNVTATASQTQTAGVALAVSLVAYFVPYTGALNGTGLKLEAAFGVDPESDPRDWTWTDLTAQGLLLESSMVNLRHGRANRSSVADPSQGRWTLKNLNGEFTSPSGTYGTQMVRNLPFRVTLTGFGVVVGATRGYVRGTFFLSSMTPRWDLSTNYAVVDIVADGRLRRLQQRPDHIHSAAYSALKLLSYLYTPTAYWPFEDESGATSAASAVTGVESAFTSGLTFAGDTSCVGSAPLATQSATSFWTAAVPTYSATGTWTVFFVSTVPTEPGAETILLSLRTSGTAALWQVTIAPGASALHLRVYSSAGTSVLDVTSSVTEADYYTFARLYVLTATQSGTGISYDLTLWDVDTGGGVTGTLASQTAGNVTSFFNAAQAGLAGVTIGHVALHVQSGAANGRSAVALAAIGGNAGETPSTRFGRLCGEQGVLATWEISENLDMLMGPQPIDTFVAALREAETIEGCVLNDSGVYGGETGVLWFPARDDRENIDASLTLDFALKQVVSIEPTLDDQDIVNSVEVSRVDGSKATEEDPISIRKEGRYREQVTVNAEDDTFLRHIAGLRVSQGTVAGMRFPTVGWNLRGSTTLAEAWLNTRLFQRVDILNPPDQYPPDDIATILEGYEEQISAATWTVRANLSPYDPNHIFVIADPSGDTDEWLGRLTGDPDCALRTAITTSGTSLLVDPNRTRWTTDSDDFPLDILINKEVVTLSGIATTAATFVAAGTAAHADNSTVTPTLPAGATTGDLLLILAAIRSSGTGLVTTPTGYTRLPVFSSTDNVQLFGKVHTGSESNPAVQVTGGVGGDTVSANMIALRGTPTTLTDLTDVVVEAHTLLNAAAQNITVPGVYPIQVPGTVVLYLGWKQDDWTSAATPTGFTEAFESSSTTGNDQAIVLGYVIQTTPACAAETTVTITGGAAAISRGAMVALAAGYQTFTASARSVNGVTKAHTAGMLIEVDDAGNLGM